MCAYRLRKKNLFISTSAIVFGLSLEWRADCRLGSVAHRLRGNSGRRLAAFRSNRVCCAALFCLLLVAPSACSTSNVKAADCSASTSTCSVLWGVAVQGGSASKVNRLEHSIGQRFDFVYSYHDIDSEIPSRDDLKLSKSGHQLHISVIPRDFTAKNKNTVLWSDVASGRYDKTLIRQAKGIQSLPGKVFLTFDHEPDQATKAARGTPTDYINAWRHVHDLYKRLGVDNVTWVWVMMGWKPAFERAGKLWPGNRYVDWISWEAYNHSGCRQGDTSPRSETSFRTTIEQAYRWFYRDGEKFGIDPKKPMMISESASVLYKRSPNRTAKWYAAIPNVLSQYPQIRAVTLFDLKVDNCDFRFQKQRSALEAVKNVMRLTTSH